MSTVRNVFHFQSSSPDESLVGIRVALGLVQRLFWPVLKFQIFEEYALQGSSSGMAAPTAFWGGSINAIFQKPYKELP